MPHVFERRLGLGVADGSRPFSRASAKAVASAASGPVAFSAMVMSRLGLIMAHRTLSQVSLGVAPGTRSALRRPAMARYPH